MLLSRDIKRAGVAPSAYSRIVNLGARHCGTVIPARHQHAAACEQSGRVAVTAKVHLTCFSPSSRSGIEQLGVGNRVGLITVTTRDQYPTVPKRCRRKPIALVFHRTDGTPDARYV